MASNLGMSKPFPPCSVCAVRNAAKCGPHPVQPQKPSLTCLLPPYKAGFRQRLITSSSQFAHPLCLERALSFRPCSNALRFLPQSVSPISHPPPALTLSRGGPALHCRSSDLACNEGAARRVAILNIVKLAFFNRLILFAGSSIFLPR